MSLGKVTRSRPHAFIAKRRPDDLVEFTIADLMTSSAAAAAILVLFDGSVFATIVIAFTFEVIRMAARAIRFICRGDPGGHLNAGVNAVHYGTSQLSVT